MSVLPSLVRNVGINGSASFFESSFVVTARLDERLSVLSLGAATNIVRMSRSLPEMPSADASVEPASPASRREKSML